MSICLRKKLLLKGTLKDFLRLKGMSEDWALAGNKAQRMWLNPCVTGGDSHSNRPED